MPITALPTPPSRSDPTNFAARGDAFLGAMPVFGTEATALQVDVNAKQVTTTNAANAAAISASGALDSASAAATSAGAVLWVASTAYSIGNVVWSPANRLVYRRIVAGTTTTDPSADVSNWAPMITPIASGGTGAVTAAAARTNLGFEPAVRATPLTGLSLTDRTSVTAVDTALAGIGKLQTQVAALPPLGRLNRIDNPQFAFDNRVKGAGSADNYIFSDRWRLYNQPNSTNLRVEQLVDAPTPTQMPGTYGVCASLTVPTALASPAAGTLFGIHHIINGGDISDAAFGTSAAVPITISFWVKSSMLGTFSGSIRNGGSTTRSYVFEYIIGTINVWEKKTVTIPGELTGTWPKTLDSQGMKLFFAVSGGSNYKIPPNVWTLGEFLLSNNQVNMLASTANSLRITGIQLEVGGNASPLEIVTVAKGLELCQRYWWAALVITTTNGANSCDTWTCPVQMRPGTFTFADGSGNASKVETSSSGANQPLTAGGGVHDGNVVRWQTIVGGATPAWIKLVLYVDAEF